MNSHLLESTVQLCQIDGARKPTGVASGCLLSYLGKRFLLTVEHATGNFGNWSIELGYDKLQGAVLYQLGSMNFVQKFTLLDDSSEVVDFSYVEIPNDLEVARHYLTIQGDLIKKDIIHTYSDTSVVAPHNDESYAFSGCVMPAFSDNPFDQNRPHLNQEFRCYEGLVFLREENDFLVFKLPFEHPGHEHFKGCSGAPVISSRNEVVGLVSNGNSRTGEIFAISLRRMIVILEASIFAQTINK